MAKLAFTVLAIGLCGSLGCNQIADINDPIPRDSVNGPGPNPAAPPGSPPSGGDTSKFLGSWTGSITTILTTCSDGADGSDTVNDIVTGTESSNGFRLTEPVGCSVEFTVNGNVGTAIPGAVCTVTNNGVQYSLTTNAGSFTLASGTSGTLRLSGKENHSDGLDTGSCDFIQQGPFTKGGGT